MNQDIRYDRDLLESKAKLLLDTESVNNKYAEAVEILARDKINFIFPNNKSHHTTMVMHVFAKFVKKEMYLYLGRPNEPATNGILDWMSSLNTAWDDDRILHLAYHKGTINPDFFNQINPQHLDLWEADEYFENQLATTQTNQRPFAFTATDTGAYRMQRQYGDRLGICNCSDSQRSEKLIKIFNKLKNESINRQN